MSNLWTEGQVIDDRVDRSTHRRVFTNFQNFKLLGTHQTICDIFCGGSIQSAISQIKFLDLLEVSQNLTNSFGFLIAQLAVDKLEDLQTWLEFEAWVKIIS